MRTSHRSTALVLVAATALLAGCGPAVLNEAEPQTIRPGAPSEPGHAVHSAEITAPPSPGHTEADVLFMQGMIVHHAQALEMTSLVPERTERDDIRRLAQRIEASQEDEIMMMQRWLAARGETAPQVGNAGHTGHAGHGDHHGHHAGMPGMLTPEDLTRLGRATGTAFDRLFLELMILHHEGALIMVEELFSEGAGQEVEVFQFASHADSDQRIEIQRMRRMLRDSPNQE